MSPCRLKSSYLSDLSIDGHSHTHHYSQYTVSFHAMFCMNAEIVPRLKQPDICNELDPILSRRLHRMYLLYLIQFWRCEEHGNIDGLPMDAIVTRFRVRSYEVVQHILGTFCMYISILCVDITTNERDKISSFYRPQTSLSSFRSRSMRCQKKNVIFGRSWKMAKENRYC